MATTKAQVWSIDSYNSSTGLSMTILGGTAVEVAIKIKDASLFVVIPKEELIRMYNEVMASE